MCLIAAGFIEDTMHQTGFRVYHRLSGSY